MYICIYIYIHTYTHICIIGYISSSNLTFDHSGQAVRLFPLMGDPGMVWYSLNRGFTYIQTDRQTYFASRGLRNRGKVHCAHAKTCV